MFLKILQSIGTILFAGAVGAYGQQLTPVVSTSQQIPGAASDRTATLQQHYPRYVLKRQDVLRLTFALTPELDQTVTVQPDGYINLNGAPSVHIEGLTVPEVETVLKAAYTATLNNPIIHVDLKDFQKPFFTVNGQVGRPGQYDLRSDVTVAEAIAVAGGLAPTAKNQIYLFQRTSGPNYKVTKLDAKKIMNGTNQSDNIMIRPGDMIVVPESGLTTFKKYVPYSVGGFINPIP